jgi:hypothetical protein
MKWGSRYFTNMEDSSTNETEVNAVKEQINSLSKLAQIIAGKEFKKGSDKGE